MKSAPPKSFRFDPKSVPAGPRRIREKLRARCLELPGAVEEFPWGDAGTYKVRGKIFASTGVNGGAYEVSFKPPPEERDDALALPFVRVADYVGRYGWVQASLTKVGQIELIWPWIAQAHARLSGGRRRSS